MSRFSSTVALAVALSAPASASAAEDSEHDLPVLPAHVVKAPELPSELLIENHGWLRVAYHPSAFETVRRVVQNADSVRASLATILGQSVLEKVELRVALTEAELATLAPADAPPPNGAQGVAYPTLGLVVVSLRTATGAAVDIDELTRHQLAHVALFDATAGRQLPRWLQEGFAVQTSGEAWASRAHTLAMANARGALVSFDRLESFGAGDLRLARAESADFVRYLSRGDQRAFFAATIAHVRSGDTLSLAATSAYGRDLRSLEQSWRDDVGHRYVTVPLVATAITGWAAAVAIWGARRRKKKRALAAEPVVEPTVEASPPARRTSPKLIVCDRGVGHVVYIVAGRGIPKVEHEGKRHTLH